MQTRKHRNANTKTTVHCIRSRAKSPGASVQSRRETHKKTDGNRRQPKAHECMEHEDDHSVGECGAFGGRLVPVQRRRKIAASQGFLHSQLLSVHSLNRSLLLRCSPCGSRMVNTCERTTPRHNRVASYGSSKVGMFSQAEIVFQRNVDFENPHWSFSKST